MPPCPKWLRLVRLRSIEVETRGASPVKPLRARAFEVISERGTVLQGIFKSLANGTSPHGVATKLNADETPPWQRSGWNAGYIRRLRQNRAVVGELRVPHGTEGLSDSGTVIPNFYPTVITEQLWRATQQTMRATGKPGRNSAETNLFRGLVYSSLDGALMGIKETYSPPTSDGKRARYAYLVSRNGTHRIRYRPFQQAMLGWLERIAPDIFAGLNAPASSGALSGESDAPVMWHIVKDGPILPSPDDQAGLHTAAERRRTRIEICRIILRVDVLRDGGEFMVHSTCLPPVIVTPVPQRRELVNCASGTIGTEVEWRLCEGE
jgi:hypothetical protein